MRSCPITFALATAIVLLSGCRDDPATSTQITPEAPVTPLPAVEKKYDLVLYSAHSKAHMRGRLDRFENAFPEIFVELVALPADELLERLRAERDEPRADLWCGVPDRLLAAAAAEGLLQKFTPAWAGNVPAAYHSPGDLWYGTFISPTVIVYNRDYLTAETAPTSLDDLMQPQWQGRIVLADPLRSDIMQTIFGLLICRLHARDGKPGKGFDWLQRLHGNTAVYVEPDKLYENLTADTPVSIWHLDDVHRRQQAGTYPLGIVVPLSPTPVQVEGLAVVAGAPNIEASAVFYNFLTRSELVIQVNESDRIPARADVPADRIPAWMTQYRITPSKVDWRLFAQDSRGWMAHWRKKIRGEKTR
ncbi:MAG: extracellular solute-binding protein [Lentisphaeria bacterium]|jgi:iron(III) transport system substrate-binding protein|nr:extracellular solute-binding protein [Lentisphaeria bacterium]